jgi:hypothetical protein
MKILPFLLFGFGIWFFNVRILDFSFAYVPGDLGDARFINYLLEHGYQWITGDEPSFWSARFMYPRPDTIAISDNMIGTLPIYSFWRVIGMEMETAYQFWWISISALNYWVCYFIVKRWFGRTDLAILAAFVFAFTTFNLYQMSYMQMNIRFMIPIAIYAAVKLVETGSRKHFMIYVTAIVLQMYSVIYTGFFLLYFTIGFIVLYALISKNWSFFKNRFTRTEWIPTLSVSIIGIVLLGVLMYPYLQTSNELGLRLFGEVKWSLPVVEAYLFPHDSSIWGFLHNPMKPNVDEWWLQSVFIGILPLIVMISIPFLWIYWRVKGIKISKLIKTISITILIIALLFLRLDNGWTLYALIFKLPGMNSMRVLNRFMHVELFFVILFLVLLLKKHSQWIVLSTLALLIIDNSFLPEKTIRSEKEVCISRRERVERLIREKGKDRNFYSAFVVQSSKEPAHLVHLDAMIASLKVNTPTINGYTSGCPDDFGEFFIHANDNGLNHWINVQQIDREKILFLKLD